MTAELRNDLRERAGELRGDVHQKRAAEGDVEHLVAAADV